MPLSLALKRNFTAEKPINLYGSPPRTRSRAYAHAPHVGVSPTIYWLFLPIAYFATSRRAKRSQFEGKTLRSSYKPLSWFNDSIPANMTIRLRSVALRGSQKLLGTLSRFRGIHSAFKDISQIMKPRRPTFTLPINKFNLRHIEYNARTVLRAPIWLVFLFQVF